MTTTLNTTELAPGMELLDANLLAHISGGLSATDSTMKDRKVCRLNDTTTTTTSTTTDSSIPV